MATTPRAERIVVQRVVTRNRAAYAAAAAALQPVLPRQPHSTSRLCPSCRCAGTGLEGAKPPERHAASAGCYRQLQQVILSALAHDDQQHQLHLVLNTYTAQHAGPPTKAPRAWLSLMGLHLGLHHGWNGLRVSRALQHHIELQARVPRLTVTFSRWDNHVAHVARAEPGPERDLKIVAWADEVWRSWAPVHSRVLMQCPACHEAKLEQARRPRAMSL